MFVVPPYNCIFPNHSSTKTSTNAAPRDRPVNRALLLWTLPLSLLLGSLLSGGVWAQVPPVEVQTPLRGSGPGDEALDPAALLQAELVAAFLEALSANPAFRAARASLEAAQAQLEAAKSPVSVSVSGGFTALDNETVALDDEISGIQGLPDTGRSQRTFPFARSSLEMWPTWLRSASSP